MDKETDRPSRVQFLIEAANLLPPKNRTLQLLQSFYLSRSRKLDSKSEQPHPAFSNEEMCIKCSTPWRLSNFTVSVEAVQQSRKRSQKIHRLIEQRNAAKQFYLKRQMKSCNNSVIVKCSLCGNKSKSILWKKHAAAVKQNEITEPPPQDMATDTSIGRTQEQNAKRKKKKKDKTAGLKFTMIKPADRNRLPKGTDDSSQQNSPTPTQRMLNLSLQEPNAHQPVSDSSTAPQFGAGQQKQANKQAQHTVSQQKPSGSLHKPSVSLQKPMTSMPKPNKSQQKAHKNRQQPNINFQKPANKSQQKKSIQPTAKLSLSKNMKNAPPKNAAQTAKMKKNSLMQLANALKSKGDHNSTNSTQERLHKMFK